MLGTWLLTAFTDEQLRSYRGNFGTIRTILSLACSVSMIHARVGAGPSYGLPAGTPTPCIDITTSPLFERIRGVPSTATLCLNSTL
jgi:hypothetical protein